MLHPVPLPRGGGQPADDRRDRPGRARSPSSSSAPSRRGGRPRPGRRAVSDLMPGAGQPGARRRGARRAVPGPEPDPDAARDPGALGWLPREELVALARDTAPAAVRDRGPGLASTRTSAPSRRRRSRVHVCHDLSCWLRGAEDRIGAVCTSGTTTTPTSSCVEVSCLGRCDVAPAVAVDEQPAPAVDDRRAGRGRPRPARRRRPAAPSSSRPAGRLAQRPLRAGRAALPGAARAAGRRR